jgi:hypothetical protein
MSAHWPLIALFVLLQALDLLSTRLALQVGLVEANPFAALLMRWGGEGLAYGFKAGATLAVVATVLALAPRFPRLVVALQLGAGLMALVVAANLANLLLG